MFRSNMDKPSILDDEIAKANNADPALLECTYVAAQLHHALLDPLHSSSNPLDVFMLETPASVCSLSPLGHTYLRVDFVCYALVMYLS